ncbi:MAG: drug/metabolite transporter (DMT)-like permease [Candidatus Paceibacteria bacterium]|jgi:drug/metabolite transporter (DMT)-like permease
MIYLLATSLLWAFSFGLIKGKLAGVDPNFVAFARLGISALVFLPLLRVRGLQRSIALKLVGVGGVQFGLMYVLYIRSYGHLAAHEVALFTVLTPLYVALFSGSSARRKAWSASLLACAGAAVISWNPLGENEVWVGFLLVQAANACFAAGQLTYKRLAKELDGRKQSSVFGLLYLGGVLVAGVVAAALTNWSALEVSQDQQLTLLYLGLLPSGLGFFLWNLGATKVSEPSLAVLNNVKVPLAVLVSLTIFGEASDLLPLAVGSSLLGAAVWLVRPAGL